MSILNHTSRLNCFGSAAVVAAMALMATAASGGTVPVGTFESAKGGFIGVTESGPPANYTPPTPQFSDNPALQLLFTPSNFQQFVVETSGTTPFDFQYKTGQVSVPMITKPLVNDPNWLGWEMTGLSLNLGGSYSLNAPFDGGRAKVSMAGQYTVQVTQLDWNPNVSIPIPQAYSTPFTIVPDVVTEIGPTPGFVDGTWSGSVTVDWAALKTAAGILPSQRITGAKVQFTTDIAAASIYGAARTSVLNFSVNVPIAPVAVPEPPTIILAGLGAAAAVGHGYRRRKLRQRDADGSDAEWTAEEGAIALTA